MEGLSVIKNLFLGNLPTFGLTTRDQANISLTCWKLYRVFTNQERALLATGMTLAEIKEQQDTSPYACKKCGLSRHLNCPLDIHGCFACFRKGTDGFLFKHYERFFTCFICRETKSRDFIYPPVLSCAWCKPEFCDYEKCSKCLNYFKCSEKENHLNCGYRIYNADLDEIEFIPVVEVFNNTDFFPPEN